MRHHIVFRAAGIGILSALGAGQPRAARLKAGRGRQRRIVLGAAGIGILPPLRPGGAARRG